MKGFFWGYIYYRITQAYFKWDGRNGITAVLGVSMIQVLLSADLILIFLRIIFSRQQIAPYSKYMAYPIVIIFLIVAVINDFKYKNKFASYKSVWKDEPEKEKFIKGLLVIGLLILPWVPLILLGVKK